MDVLLIDDEYAFLDVLLKRLRKRGIKAISANSGESGLSALSEYRVDVVVLDVCMPEMDGLKTLKKIKQRWPLIEVILLTGHASVKAAREGMDKGAFDYLMKPVDINELVYKLEDAYGKAQFLTKKNGLKKGGD